MIRDLTTTILINDKSFTGNINEQTAYLNNTINHMHPTDIYRTLHPVKAQYSEMCMDLFWIDQDWSYVRPQNKACQIEEDWNNTNYFLGPYGWNYKSISRRKLKHFLNVKSIWYTPVQSMNQGNL